MKQSSMCIAGDLTCNNVLLSEEKTDPRGFRIKVPALHRLAIRQLLCASAFAAGEVAAMRPTSLGVAAHLPAVLC
jgi:hypothetical protein